MNASQPAKTSWTFLPFELEAEPTWAIYDDNLARIVARFYVEDEAQDYLRWRNDRQTVLKNQQIVDKLKAENIERQHFSDADDFDNDGRC